MGVLVQGGGDGLNRTFGRLKVRQADKSAEPIGPPNPGPVKSGGPPLGWPLSGAHAWGIGPAAWLHVCVHVWARATPWTYSKGNIALAEGREWVTPPAQSLNGPVPSCWLPLWSMAQRRDQQKGVECLCPKIPRCPPPLTWTQGETTDTRVPLPVHGPPMVGASAGSVTGKLQELVPESPHIGRSATLASSGWVAPHW